MADSMLDFGGAARNMLAMGNLLEAQERNDLTAQHQDLERQRLQQQEKQFRETAFQQELKNTYELSKDERLQFIPEVRNKLLLKAATMAGSPDIGINAMTNHMEVRDQYLKGLVSGDRDEAMKGLQGLATSMPVDKLDNLMKATVGMEETQEKIAKIKLWREMNAGKVDALQRDNAKVQISKPLYTAVSATFRDELRGTESPQFKRLQAIRNAAPDKDWLSKEAATQLGSTVFPHLIGGKSSQKAEQMKMAADKYAEQVNADQKLLEDADHGIALPKNVSKHELQARIEAHSTLLGAVRDMQSWYENPLDKDKLAAAKAAYTTIESRRLDIEKLEKNTGARTSQYQQDALSFRQTESEIKHGEKSALAQAQVQYYELPVNQQTPQAAAKIAKSIQESTGMPVQVDDIIKNPNKPLVENKTIIDNANNKLGEQMAKDVGEIIKESHSSALGASDILDGVTRIRTAMNSGNVTVGPGATLRNKGNQIMEFMGMAGKDTTERLVNTRQTIKALAQFSINARKLLRGQGQITENEQKLLIKAESGEIDDFTLPELKTVMDVSERLARKAYNRHQSNLDKARKNPAAQHLVPFYELDALPDTTQPSVQASGAQKKPSSKAAPQKQSGTVLKELPKGSRRIGTSGGKPVYEDANGKKWIGE